MDTGNIFGHLTMQPIINPTDTALEKFTSAIISYIDTIAKYKTLKELASNYPKSKSSDRQIPTTIENIFKDLAINNPILRRGYLLDEKFNDKNYQSFYDDFSERIRQKGQSPSDKKAAIEEILTSIMNERFAEFNKNVDFACDEIKIKSYLENSCQRITKFAESISKKTDGDFLISNPIDEKYQGSAAILYCQTQTVQRPISNSFTSNVHSSFLQDVMRGEYKSGHIYSSGPINNSKYKSNLTSSSSPAYANTAEAEKEVLSTNSTSLLPREKTIPIVRPTLTRQCFLLIQAALTL